MAGKKKAQYEDALQSISDFIFKHSGKREKLRPGKISGASGADALARQLAEIASKPAVHVSESLMRSINDTLGSPTLLQFHLDKLDAEKHKGSEPNSSRFRVRNQEVGSLIANPVKYVQGVYDNAAAERKWAAKVGFAGYVDGAVALLWAKKSMGASLSDSLRMFAAANYDLQPIHKEEAHKLASETAAYEMYKNKDRAKEAAEDLYKALNSSSLTRASKASIDVGVMGREFQQTLSAGEKDFLKKVAGKTSLSDDETKLLKSLKDREKSFGTRGDKYSERYKALESYLGKIENPTGGRKYSPAEVQALLDRYIDSRDLSKIGLSPGEYAEIGKAGDLTPTSFRRLLTKNYEAKMARLDPVKDKEEIEKLSKSISAVGLWQRAYGTPSGDDYKDIIGKFKTELARKDLPLGRRKIIEQELKKAESDFREFSDRRASALAAFSTVTDIPKIGQMRKDLAKVVHYEYEYWQGKFDEYANLAKSGPLTPEQKKDMERARTKIGILSTEKSQLSTLPWAGARITVGQVSNMMRTYQTIFGGGLGGQLANGMFWVEDAGNALAPGTMGNIEIFGKDFTTIIKGVPVARKDIHPGYANMVSFYYMSPSSWLKTIWNGEWFAHAANLRQEAARKILYSYKDDLTGILGMSGDDFDEALKGNYLNLMDKIKATNHPILKKFAGKVDSLSQTTALLGKAANLFYKNLAEPYSKLWGGINNKIMGAVGNFLKGNIQNELWLKAVDQFAAGAIGIKQLIRKGVDAILIAAGFVASGGAASLVLGFVSYIITEGIYKLGKPILEVLASAFSAFMILFLGVLLIIIGLIFGPDITDRTDPYRAYYPGLAIACVEYNPHAGMYPEPPEEGGSGFPPSDSTCPFTFTPAICTQGSGGNSSDYHQSTKAIDIGTGGVPVNQDVWYAPSDGRISKFQAVNICQGTGMNYGGWLEFKDNSGTTYTLLHVRALAPVGPVKKGTAIALTQRDLVADGWCWTGPHYHLHVASGGGYVDAEDWYRNKLKCSFSVCP